MVQGFKIFFIEVGEVVYFTIRFFKEVWFPPYELKELLKQCFQIGNKSLPLVGLTSFIIGLVMTLQSRPTLMEFGAESWLPKMVGLSIIRELGPVIIALICAGKIGSSIGAELGSMKVTEQIDAMEVSGTNPFKYIVVTRILSTTFMIPILIIIGDFISLIGSYIAIKSENHFSIRLFFNQVFESLSFSDILPSFVKTFFFGFAIGLIGCYKGYNTKKGTEGVGESANYAVVISSILVFIIDLIVVQVTKFLGYL